MENEKDLIIEAETLEENMLLPEDVAVLRAEMYSEISYAVSLGVFTDSEASEWKNGFEACTEISHMENLIDIIDSFVASGLAVVGKIEDLLDSELITEIEKNQWRNMTESASFDEKKDMIYELKSVIKKIEVLKQKLITTLDKKGIESNQKETLLKKFVASDDISREKIIKKAEQLKVKVVSNTKKPSIEKNNQISEAEKNLKIKTKYQEAITYYLETSKFKTARKILENGRKYFLFGEYSSISESIDVKEIQATKKDIKLVA